MNFNPCQIDWMAIAAWIGALSTFGLLCAAFLGYRLWKKQFFGQRDHDLALRILRSLHLSSQELDAFRSPRFTIMDGDVQMEPSNLSDPELDYEYRRMWAIYQSRRNHMFEHAESRINTICEAELVWPGLRGSLGELGSQLTDVEIRVVTEAHKYVNSLNPHVRKPEEIDEEVLHANRDGKDAVKDEYTRLIDRISDLITPKIRMK